MYAVDVGWALTLVYFGAQLALILRHGFRHRLPGATMAAVIAFVLPHVSSALAWSNLTGTFLWSTLALVVLAGTIDRQPPPGASAFGRARGREPRHVRRPVEACDVAVVRTLPDVRRTPGSPPGCRGGRGSDGPAG